MVGDTRRIGGIVTGLMFVACVLMFRRGVVGEIAVLLERVRRRGNAASHRRGRPTHREVGR